MNSTNAIKLATLTELQVAINAGNTATSNELPLNGFGPRDSSLTRVPVGNFSLDVTFTGTGTLTANVLISNGNTFKAFEGATSIISGKVAGSYVASFSLPVCRAFKITLTASTNTCTVTECIVAMQ